MDSSEILSLVNYNCPTPSLLFHLILPFMVIFEKQKLPYVKIKMKPASCQSWTKEMAFLFHLFHLLKCTIMTIVLVNMNFYGKNGQ